MGENCCQLHLHSAHSFKDGLAPVADLVARAAELEQPGIGLTDHGVLFGAAQFFKACDKHAIQGVIGMEIYEAVPHTFDPDPKGPHMAVFKNKWQEGVPRYFHLTLWAQNEVGWRNLCAIHTLSFTEAYKPKNQPLVDRATLEAHSEGLIVGLGCMASRTNVALAQGGDGYEEAKWYADVFGDRLYAEVMSNLPEQTELLRPQRKLAQRLGCPTLATNDVHYVAQADGVEGGPHHTLVQARRWKKKEGAEESGDRSDAGFGQWYGSDEFYLKSEAEMLATSGLLPDEVHRSIEVLDRVDFDFLELPKPAAPQAPVPAEGEDPAFDSWLSVRGT